MNATGTIRAALAVAVVRSAAEHGTVIPLTGEPYWNEPVPDAAEFHAPVEVIHQEVAAYRERA